MTTKVVFPTFREDDVSPYDMRQLVSALELRFQSLESDENSIFPSITSDLDARYSLVGHTHVVSEITDFADNVPSSIFDLSDVTGTPSIGQALLWNGTAFAPGSAGGGATTLDSLTDVIATGATDGQTIVFDSSTLRWRAETPVSSGIDTIFEALDTDLLDQEQGDLLFNSGGAEWQPTGFNFQWIDGAYVQLGNAIGVNWYNSAFSSVEMLNFSALTPPGGGAPVQTFQAGDPAYETQIDGTLTTITGNAQIDGTANVTGAATLGNGLTVTGANIVAGTVDADFDDITATTYGGILEANLLDKTAAEVVSGEWRITPPSGNANLIIRKPTATDQAKIRFESEAAIERWSFGITSLANDDFFLARYDESGVFQDAPIYIRGFDGIVSFPNRVDVDGGMLVSSTTYIEATNLYQNMKSSSSVNGGVKLFDSVDVLRGYLFFNADGFGLLGDIGQWAVRVPPGTDDVEMPGNVDITGNLTVGGTTTTINSNVVSIADNIITLNSDEVGVPSQNAGIEVERGTSANVLVRWNETSDRWEFTNDGSTYNEFLISGDAGTVVDGTVTNAMLRWDGADWVEESSATLDAAGALTATSFGGITSANLLDKSAAETVSDSYTFSKSGLRAGAAIQIEAAQPSIYFTDTDAIADEKNWDIFIDTGHFNVRTATDVDGFGITALQIERTGTAPTAWTFTGTSYDFSADGGSSNVFEISAGVVIANQPLRLNHPGAGGNLIISAGNSGNVGRSVFLFEDEGGTDHWDWVMQGDLNNDIYFRNLLDSSVPLYFDKDQNHLLMRDGWALRIQDAGDTDYAQFNHDGTDFNTLFVNTTDWNITGITAIQAGTVDADFDALTATSYGGIPEANLLDKTATETVSGAYTFTANPTIQGLQPTLFHYETDAALDEKYWKTLTSSGDYYIQATNDALGSSVTGFRMIRSGTTIDSIQLNATTLDFNGNADVSGALTATSYGGITEANLLDKTAAETVTGQWIIDPDTAGPFLTLGDGTGADGDTLLRFHTDRAWSFKQLGDDASAQLQLYAESGGKEFRIGSAIFASAFRFAPDTGNFIAAGDITGATVATITASNLLDKTADEIVSGGWRMDDDFKIDASTTTRWWRYKDLSSQVQTTSYRRSVIALCEVTNTDIDLNSYSSGRFFFKRTNGLLAGVTVDVSMEKRYNTATPFVTMTVHGAPDVLNVRPCTFTDGGVKYGGIEFYVNAAEHGSVQWEGHGNFELFGVDYYDTLTPAALDAEINSSINFVEPVTSDVISFNGSKRIPAFEQDAYPFVSSPSGDFGSVEVTGAYGAAGSWSGYSIGGDVVFMSLANGNATTNRAGVYDDLNNNWVWNFNNTTANREMTLYYNDLQQFRTWSAGVAVAGGASSDPLLEFYATQFSTRNGYIQARSTDGDFVIRGEVHGGRVVLQNEDAGGVTRNLMIGNPDGATTLYHDGSSRFQTTSVGLEFAGSDNNALGGIVTTYNIFSTSSFSDRGYFGFIGAADMEWRNINHGGGFLMRAEDAGGTLRNVLVADPDAGVDLHYTGTLALRTTVAGVDVFDTSGSNTVINFRSDAGALTGLISSDATAGVSIRGVTHGVPVSLQSEDAGGVLRTLVSGDPDAGVDLYYAGSLKLSTVSGGVDVTGALTATSYGGITEANLLDKTATETVSGAYTFTANPTIQGLQPTLFHYETDAALDEKYWKTLTSSGDYYIQTTNDALGSSVTGFRMIRSGITIDSIQLNATTLDFNGNADVSGALTAASFGGITSANLLDRAATETITGAYTFDSPPRLVRPTAGNYVIEVGYEGGAASVATLDFHTGAVATDYDTRIRSDGGNGVSGGGLMTLIGKDFIIGSGAVDGRVDFTEGLSVRMRVDHLGSEVQIRDGYALRMYDAADTDSAFFIHDGTDFNTSFVNTTDWNITGLTAIQAGTVDADFDALTATTFNGVALTTGGAATSYLDATGSYSVPPGGASTLAALTDTVITTPQSGDILKFNGTNWINSLTFEDTMVFSNVSSPFTVASTSTVTNLSAQFLSGIAAGEFLRSNVSDSWSGTLSSGGGIIIMNDNDIRRAVLEDYAIESEDLGLVTDANQTLTFSNGPVFEMDLENWTINRTITLSGGPPAGTHGQITVKIQQDGTAARTITWAGGTFRWLGGTAKVMNSTLNGISIFTFETWDGGTTWYAAGADYS